MKTDAGMRFPVTGREIAGYERDYCSGPSEERRIVVNDAHE